MKQILKRLAKAEHHESPSGSISRKQGTQAAGVGLCMAPGGAYTGEVVGLIYEGINGWAPAIIQKLMHLSFAEDLVGGATGFCVVAAVTGVWKFMRHYEVPG